MVSPSFAMGSSGANAFSSRSRLVEALEARELTFFVTGSRKLGQLQNRAWFYGHESECSRLVKNTASDPVWANSNRVPNTALSSWQSSPVRRNIFGGHSSAREGRSPLRHAPKDQFGRENTHASRPSRRIREDSGRTLGRDNCERRGFGT